MRRFSTASIIVLALTGLTAGLSVSGESKTGGTLRITPSRPWDFGYVPLDYKLSRKYTLLNTGSDTLTIKRLEPSCDCTTGELDRWVLAPGDPGAMNLIFNTRNFYGGQTKSLSIFSTDREVPERIIVYDAIIADPPGEISLSKPSIFLLPEKVEDSVTLKNNSSRDIAFRVVYQDQALFSLHGRTDAIPAGESRRILVRRARIIPIGTHYSTFTLEFRGAEVFRLSTPVKLVQY